MNSEKNKVIFFFGAGASGTEGAPIADNLLIKAIKELKDPRIERVKQFLEDIYSNNCSIKSKIPNFEELLSVIDLSLQKNEQFSNEWNYDQLLRLKQDLIFCIGTILKQKLSSSKGIHRRFVENLFTEEKWKNYAFLSLNYDILLDNALLDLGDESNLRDFDIGRPIDIDYGIEFRNEGRDWRTPGKRKIYLLKLHGSLNWLYCPTCNSIRIYPGEKVVPDFDNSRLQTEIITEQKTCENDGSNQKMLIIPPTWLKTYDNPYLISNWLTAEKLLQKASKIFFIGYSLPDADINIRFLLKKALYRSNEANPEIMVIGKNGKGKWTNTSRRYARLFGEIDYQPIGFEEFANTVQNFL